MKLTQRQLVVDHLMKHNSITSLEAIERYGITRLACVINCLRKDGFRIDSVLIPVTNRYGDTVYVSQYKMGE